MQSKGLLNKLFLIAIFGVGHISYAQNVHMIDSLRRELGKSKDKERFDLLCQIGWEHRFAYPDSTIYYSRLAYELGQKIGENKTLAIPLNYIGIAYNYTGDRLKSLEYHEKAIEVAIAQHDS